MRAYESLFDKRDAMFQTKAEKDSIYKVFGKLLI